MEPESTQSAAGYRCSSSMCRFASDEVLIAVKTAGVGNWDESVRIGDWDANSLRIAAPGRIRESPGRTPWSICRVGA